ncbi:S8 family serine peptidase [Rugamonas rubra]|uniref:Peptidase inhibitor I9 n=1 Tax=Rugamonas rubra TaxID=758825 RepID=A0A1I4QHA3_9BURK|nr:S8 family serine peptidase [Rugamonas rubra]SFM39481.1 Peptidase inhibitor I9 [Rugamonas rubra]
MKSTRLIPTHSAIKWAVAALIAGLAVSAGADETRRPYIVQLNSAPAASYNGGVAGLAATKPASGTRLDVSAASVQAYVSHLEAEQAAVVATLPAMETLYDYHLVFNGFSAMLTDAEARKLMANSAVAAITLDQPRQLDTNYTPGFIGLNKAGGLWDQLGGTSGGLNKSGAGEDIVIGIIDGGVWPENPSFADRVDSNGVATHDAAGTLVYGAPPASWKGGCESGQAFGPANCNNKLVGARAFRRSISDANGNILPSFKLHAAEFLSPRDNGGHGTHTASTAGGNANVVAVMDNGTVPVPGVSGMAPRARVATYKVCWTKDDPATTRPDPRWPNYGNGCYGNDSVAAIEQAIKDGVNVLNYSISGSGTSIADPVDLAFKGAVDAGVFVAASAGNSGPANEVNHLGPWMTTVGNSTHDRMFAGTVTLGNGAKYVGASSNPATPTAPMILAKNAGLPGVSPDDLNLQRCFGGLDNVPALLDPAKVAGKLLVCDRGANVLVNKSGNAKTAGAAGVVIANVAGGANTIINQSHDLSTVHVTRADGDLIRAYVGANGVGASGGLDDLKAIKDLSVAAPAMNDSSSRGPNKGDLNVLKPDLTAPGSSILAGYTPNYTVAEHDDMIATGGAGRPNWSLLTGTSMSSPHIAGLAALLHQRHPDWSPAMIRSALMTTGVDVVNTLSGMQQGGLPWGQGAGFAQPSSAADPGLVYDISTNDYNRYLCSSGVTPVGVTCATLASLPAYNLNLPSLTASGVFGNVTLERTVTNVGATSATYTATIAVPGFDAVVTPSTLTIGAGASAKYSVTLRRTSAVQDAWNYGALTWTDGSHVVRSPVTARARVVVAPSILSSKLATGNKTFTIGTGFAGAFSTLKGGLKAASRSSATVTGTNKGNAAAVSAACAAGGGAGIQVHNMAIPAGTLAARFALFNQDTSGYQGGGEDDLDLVMVNAAGTQVAYSGNGGSEELITLSAPAAGNYKVCVVSYAPAVPNTSTYALSSWIVQPGDTGGNLRALVPSRAVLGGTGSVVVSWSNLPAGGRYLGAIAYQVSGDKTASTLISVDTDPASLPATAQLNSGKEANAPKQ